MKGSILTAIVLAVLSISAVSAQDLLSVPAAPVPGSPGTPTPAPYPQVKPSAVPRPVSTSGSVLPLPPIKLPQPPTADQRLPGLEQDTSKIKAPGS